MLATVTFEPIRWIDRLQPAKATRWLIEGALRLISRFVAICPNAANPFHSAKCSIAPIRKAIARKNSAR